MSTPLNARIRADFPLLQRRIDGNEIIYLDSAATSLKPAVVCQALDDYHRKFSANIHRGKHFLSEQASDRHEEARYRVAEFVHCSANEVVFVRNTTEAMNMLAFGLGLEKDDVVVGTLDSHHSNILPWRQVANMKLVPPDTSGRVDLDQYESLLKAGAKVVTLTHLSNVSGCYIPLEKMVTMAKEHGAIVVVDAAQSLPHREISLRKLPVDFLAFSSHKILGPTGIGALVGRRDRLETLQPLLYGGGMVDWVDMDGHQLRKIPHRFEAGTPAIGEAHAFGVALDYLMDIGPEDLEAHDRALTAALFEEAKKRDYLHILGPEDPEEHAALLSFSLDHCDSLADMARNLSDAYGIMCRSGHLCAQPYVDSLTDGEVLRASAYIYNDVEDIHKLFSALDELMASMFGHTRTKAG